MNIQETETLAKQTPTNKILRATPDKEKLTKQVLKHLSGLKDNEAIPYFQCHLDSKAGEAFPNVFIAQWNRNAFGGWFIHVDPRAEPLGKLKRLWVIMATQKGYASTIIDTIPHLIEQLECYRHSCGLKGRQYFERRFGAIRP